MTIKIGDRVEMVEKQSKHTGKRGTVTGFAIGPFEDHLKVNFDCKDKDHVVTFPSSYFKKIEYNAGDTVTVTAIVVRSVAEFVECRFNAPKLDKDIVFSVPEADIVTHTPKPSPIQVGDSVGYGEAEFTVLSIHNDWAWLERNDKYMLGQKYYTLKLCELEHI